MDEDFDGEITPVTGPVDFDSPVVDFDGEMVPAFSFSAAAVTVDEISEDDDDDEDPPTVVDDVPPLPPALRLASSSLLTGAFFRFGMCFLEYLIILGGIFSNLVFNQG